MDLVGKNQMETTGIIQNGSWKTGIITNRIAKSLSPIRFTVQFRMMIVKYTGILTVNRKIVLLVR